MFTITKLITISVYALTIGLVTMSEAQDNAFVKETGTKSNAELHPTQIVFTDRQELNNWVIINDTVMGGRSRAAIDLNNDFLLFGGELSLQNNGGFASIRRVYSQVNWQENTSISIQVMGDGREYQLRLRTNKSWDGIAYVASFQTSAGELITLNFDTKDFRPQFRGRLVSNAQELNFADVTQVGIMLADKKPGQFLIKVKSIEQIPEII